MHLLFSVILSSQANEAAFLTQLNASERHCGLKSPHPSQSPARQQPARYASRRDTRMGRGIMAPRHRGQAKVTCLGGRWPLADWSRRPATMPIDKSDGPFLDDCPSCMRLCPTLLSLPRFSCCTSLVQDRRPRSHSSHSAPLASFVRAANQHHGSHARRGREPASEHRLIG